MSNIRDALSSMTSFEAIKFVLNGIALHDLQCVDIIKMLYQKKAIVSYDTGTGKTLLASAAIRLLYDEDPTRKFVIFVKKDQLTQTPKKMSDATGLSVISSSGEAARLDSLLRGDKFLNYPILMLTHSCLLNHRVMKALFMHREKYCTVIIDEAHEISNEYYAEAASIVSGIVAQAEYAWALTATPITTDSKQLAKLASLIDKKKFPSEKKLERAINNGYFTIEQDPTFFINRSGEELGRKSNYRGKILWVDAMVQQHADTSGDPLMLLCKGDGAVAQANALCNLIKSYEGRRGLVYINQHAVRNWVLPFLDRAGIKYGCINGKTNVTTTSEVLRQFNEEKSLDVVITSCTTAIDLDCDFVIFYEFTVLLKQMIGRADRGLQGKTVDIWYIITRGSNEPMYFNESIMKRSTMIQEVLSKDYTELDNIADDLYQELNR